MNPDACLRDILAQFQLIELSDRESDKVSLRPDCVETLHSLATWIQNGGFPPLVDGELADWIRNRS